MIPISFLFFRKEAAYSCEEESSNGIEPLINRFAGGAISHSSNWTYLLIVSFIRESNPLPLHTKKKLYHLTNKAYLKSHNSHSV